jgi:hypothetical protein
MPATDVRTPRRWSAQVLLGSAAALCAGLGIAWVDSRPGWDDAGLTAAALVITAALASLARVPPWLAAVLVAGPMLVAELSSGTGVLLAIPFAIAGACAGVFVRRRFARS